MKIITKKGAKKIAKNLAQNIYIIFLKKGIKLKTADILALEFNFCKALGGKKNGRTHKNSKRNNGRCA